MLSYYKDHLQIFGFIEIFLYKAVTCRWPAAYHSKNYLIASKQRKVGRWQQILDKPKKKRTNGAVLQKKNKQKKTKHAATIPRGLCNISLEMVGHCDHFISSLSRDRLRLKMYPRLCLHQSSSAGLLHEQSWWNRETSNFGKSCTSF